MVGHLPLKENIGVRIPARQLEYYLVVRSTTRTKRPTCLRCCPAGTFSRLLRTRLIRENIPHGQGHCYLLDLCPSRNGGGAGSNSEERASYALGTSAGSAPEVCRRCNAYPARRRRTDFQKGGRCAKMNGTQYGFIRTEAAESSRHPRHY